MNLQAIDPSKFRPLGKRLLVERMGAGYEGRVVIPDAHQGPQMTSGIEPPVLYHFIPRKCKVLSVGLEVQGVAVGDIVDVPGSGNCYADAEDGNRILIRQGDITGKYESA
jgi:hypothetical protein